MHLLRGRDRIMSIDIDVSDHGRLTGLRASLSEEFAVQTARLKELTEISADTGDPGEAHNRAALVAATRHSLEQITGALLRIAEGGYGRCESCDTLIPAERLEVLPHAPYCVPCQEKHNG
jgi:DnaK suppressor protein